MRHLADWGADVIRIEPPPSAGSDTGGDRDGFDYQNLHRNKRAMVLDLKLEEGREIFFRLAAQADVIVETMRARGAGGKAFASGADISEFEKARADSDAEKEYASHSSRARALLGGLDVPLIAMIHGFCIGGGMATALQADLRIASSDGRFGIPAARLGVSYGYESLERLTAFGTGAGQGDHVPGPPVHRRAGARDGPRQPGGRARPAARHGRGDRG